MRHYVGVDNLLHVRNFSFIFQHVHLMQFICGVVFLHVEGIFILLSLFVRFLLLLLLLLLLLRILVLLLLKLLSFLCGSCDGLSSFARTFEFCVLDFQIFLYEVVEPRQIGDYQINILSEGLRIVVSFVLFEGDFFVNGKGFFFVFEQSRNLFEIYHQSVFPEGVSQIETRVELFGFFVGLINDGLPAIELALGEMLKEALENFLDHFRYHELRNCESDILGDVDIEGDFLFLRNFVHNVEEGCSQIEVCLQQLLGFEYVCNVDLLYHLHRDFPLLSFQLVSHHVQHLHKR